MRSAATLRRAAAALVAAAALAGGVQPAAAGSTTQGTARPCNKDDFQLIEDRPYPLVRLGAQRVWQRTTGRDVVVAVVDSGVDRRNPHLTESVMDGVSLLPGDPDPLGLTDVTGHGTAVAGTIAARPVEGSGVLGLAYEARILPIRVYQAGEDEPESRERGWTLDAGRVAEGIRVAADRGARIINVSISQPAPDERLDEAVAYATSRGALVVASGGNRNTSADKRDVERYPGASPGALAVGAVDSDDDLSEDSVRGPHIDVVGVGGQVTTTYLDRGDCLIEGEDASTSLATGYVSAAAALVAQVYPEAGPEEIAYRLMASADRPRRAARDDSRGWGLVQPLDAVTMTLDPGRPGPPLPGTEAVAAPAVEAASIRVGSPPDPTAPQREAAAWWLLLGGMGLGLALLAGRWVSARREGGSGGA